MKQKSKKTPNLISISGKIGSGKDTVGQIIQMLTANQDIEGKFTLEEIQTGKSTIQDYTDWQIKKFADKLKDMVCLLLGCTREDLEDREFKNKVLGEEWWYFKTLGLTTSQPYILKPYIGNENLADENILHSYKLIKLTPRKLMQLLGTDAGRNIIHPDIWCNSLFSEYYGDIEEWKNINNYEGLYQVSSFGNIRSLDREIIYGDKSEGEYHNRKGQLLKPTLSGGYKTVSLSGKTFTVHSLVGEHFLHKPYGDFVLNHKDYNKENNFYKNLEYVTQKTNIEHNYLVGNANIGTKQKDSKLNEEQVLKIRKLLNTNISQNKIAKLFNVSPTTITDIKKGRKWKHVGRKFKEIKPIVPISPPNWIITDTRFLNEIEAVKQRGGINIRINRKQNNYYLPLEHYEGLHRNNMLNGNIETIRKYFHPSETALDNYQDFDYVIDNSGSLENLIEKVKNILIDLKIIE